MGNVLKDVYLNLDSRTEKFESDRAGISWLDLSFDASEHHFFNRGSSFGGATISLEVFKKMGIEADIADHSIKYVDDELKTDDPAEVYRYILVSDNGVSYFVPSNFKITSFNAPNTNYDYLFIDRSAEIDEETARKINSYLEAAKNTKLIVYLKTLDRRPISSLAERADLVFLEKSTTENAEQPQALELLHMPPEKIVHISEKGLSYLDVTEQLTPKHVDRMTHLSMYSIITATIIGCFVLGESVEKSFKLARLNAENSRLDSTLSFDELNTLFSKNESNSDIELVAANLMLAGKGILAADESGGSIQKKFAQMGIEDTSSSRRDYRNILLATPNLGSYVNGVILFDETTRQKADNGSNYVEFLTAHQIIPGIKVDQGLAEFANSSETYTKGIEGLGRRLEKYFEAGLRFAKWRAAFRIHINEGGKFVTPSNYAIKENCRLLARYAKRCQMAGLVPIVEPEVVYDGDYGIDVSSFITSKILDCLFENLLELKVNLKACILKVNMVQAGKAYRFHSTPEEVGLITAKVLRNHVPESVAGVVFLSGGQSPEQATENLTAIIANGPFPWPVSFSFARALQDPALNAWAGDNQNTEKARQAFLDRLIANVNALKA